MQAESIEQTAARAEAARRAERVGRSVLLSTTRPVPAWDPIAWLRNEPDVRALWLRPAHGEAIALRGALRSFEAPGNDLEPVAAAWRELLADAVIDERTFSPAPSVSLPHGPMLMGGLAFDPLREATALWTGFPPARFVLPEHSLVQRGGSAWLTTNELIGPPAHARDASRAWEAPAPELRSLSADAWRRLVGSTAAAIRRSENGLRKVVLARAQRITSEQPFELETALRKLATAYPTCTVFAFGSPERTFLGATPERLVTLHNGVASSMALAASMRRGESEAEDAALGQRLLSDPKERTEHAIVVDSLRESFEGVCTGVVADAEPRIERLPNVQHLLTRVRGQVRPGGSLLELVQALHPTPAMGGSPRPAALEYIRRNEGLDRGWYTGAIGWLDHRGDGDFSVAIRSALVRGREAILFAGCGIAADSDPAAEYVEAELKLRPMLGALGQLPA